MKPLLYVSILLVACGLTSCSSDDGDNGTDPDPIVIADLAGDWDCTLFLATSTEDPTVQFELIALGGALSVTVQPDGSFTGLASIPDLGAGETEVPFGGTFALVSQTVLSMQFTQEIPPFLENGTAEFTLVGNTMTIHQDVTTFDFDFDQQDDPATFDATLVR